MSERRNSATVRVPNELIPKVKELVQQYRIEQEQQKLEQIRTEAKQKKSA